MIKQKRNKKEVVYLPERPVKLLKPRNQRQADLINSICNNLITIAKGSAGTGKTFVSSSKAIDFLNAGIVSKIIITRPYISAGEKMGFLPGDIAEKYAPYLEPYLDTFTDRIGKQLLSQMLEDGRISAKPINFLQGKTFTDAIILVDEIQNATHDQIKLILTRMGENCRCVLMGDPAQTYIKDSGFADAVHILKNVPRLGIVEFEISDVVRSEVCRNVLIAYDEWNK